MAWASIPFLFFSILLSTTAGTRMEPLSTEWEKKKEKKKEKRADNDATVVSWPLLASKLARSRTSQTFFLLSLKGSPRICQGVYFLT